MKQLLTFAVLASTLAPVFAADETKPVAVVNGREIPAIYATVFKQSLLARGEKDDANLDEAVRNELVNQELMVRAAIDKGLDKNPTTATALELERRKQLSMVFIRDALKTNPISDAEIKAEYEKAKAATSGPEYKVRHILVKTEAEAKAILAQLGKKASFEKLATEKSQDPGSAKNGGDLGWALQNNFVKEFGEAMSKLKKGETTKTAVQTKFGYHIIRVDDVRPIQFPALDDNVKAEIVRLMQPARVREIIKGLREKAKIE